jgi:hypothetical protein
VDGTDGCRTCGRSFEEITRTSQLVEELTALVLDMEYRNLDEFTAYLSHKLEKKVHARRSDSINES